MLHLFFLLSFISSLPLLSYAEDETAFVYAGCSQAKYDPATPYHFATDSLVTSLTNAAGFSSYANFTVSSSSSSAAAAVYGLFQCRGDLPLAACESCVRSAAVRVGALCPAACGAALQLRGCLLRYGNDSFVGRPDDTLQYKTCGPAATGGGPGDFLGMRDAAVGALEAAQGGGDLREGAVGSVQGVAQCVGDVGPKACSECVAEAVEQLRSGCGVAVSGDVYLGKCYARYWSNGVYYSSSSSSSSKSNNNNGDDTGKTLAIIIAFIAGIALLIFFISYITRRARKGKK